MQSDGGHVDVKKGLVQIVRCRVKVLGKVTIAMYVQFVKFYREEIISFHFRNNASAHLLPCQQARMARNPNLQSRNQMRRLPMGRSEFPHPLMLHV